MACTKVSINDGGGLNRTRDNILSSFGMLLASKDEFVRNLRSAKTSKMFASARLIAAFRDVQGSHEDQMA